MSSSLRLSPSILLVLAVLCVSACCVLPSLVTGAAAGPRASAASRLAKTHTAAAASAQSAYQVNPNESDQRVGREETTLRISATVTYNCPIGSYQYGTANAASTTCPSGSAATSTFGLTGADTRACCSCAITTYTPSTSATSTTCSGTSASCCVPCPTNSLVGTPAASTCPCIAGYGSGVFTSTTPTACKICPVNTYNAASSNPYSSGSIACTACPAGLTTNGLTGQTKCEPIKCSDATFYLKVVNGVYTCTKCGQTSSSDVQADDSAKCQCRAGFGSFNPASGECTACANKFWSKGGADATCASCGTTTTIGSNAERSACLCTPGFGASSAGYVNGQSFDCVQCQNGFFSAGGTVSPLCYQCSKNSIANAPATHTTESTITQGSTTCKCSNGYSTFTSQTASSTNYGCTACAKGSSSTNGGACASCPAETYAATAGSACVYCLDAPVGSFECPTACQGINKFIDSEETIVANKCKSCPTNKAALTIVTTTTALACTSCENGNGYVDAVNGGCSSCPAGQKVNAALNGCTACDEGTFSTGANKAKTCTTCPAGSSTNNGAISCTACAAGSFSSAGNSLKCLTTEAGSFSAEGATAASPCTDSNGYSTQGSASCSACAAGKKVNVGRTGCDTCGTGTFSSTDNTLKTCTTCEAGSSTDGGAISCTICAAGSFSSLADSLTCTQAFGGFFAATGATSQTACSTTGGFSTGSASSCSSCGAGSMVNSAYTGCDACSTGSSTNGVSNLLQTCTPCVSGFVATIAGSASCAQCAAGSYANAANDACQNCDAGFSTDGVAGRDEIADGASTCEMCVAGTKASSGDASCSSCESGFIAGSFGLDTCTICPAGTFANADDVTCDACASGSFSAGGVDSCTMCGAGSFTASATVSCSPCVAGSWSSDATNAACTRCPEDWISSGSAAADSQVAACTECAPKFAHHDTLDLTVTGLATECVACGPNSFTPAAGSPGEGVCASCEDGQDGNGAIVTGSGMTREEYCFSCADGQTSFAGQFCQDCPAGTFGESGIAVLNTAGGTSTGVCTACPAGEMQTATGQTVCIKCGPGSYTVDATQSCVSCPAGSISTGDANTACSECAAGTYSNMAGDACTPCATGTFSAAGVDTCTACAAGTVATTTGSASCTSCTAGTFSNVAGDDCTPCATGSFSAVGVAACTMCGAGSFTTSATVACSPCVAGSWSSDATNAACTRCPEDWISLNVAGQTTQGAACVSCGLEFAHHSTTDASVAGLATECIPCGPHSFLPVSGICTPCEAGQDAGIATMSGTQREGYCFTCAPGLTSVPGEACKNCPVGTFGENTIGNAANTDDTKLGVCTACGTGEAQSSTGQIECAQCGKGTYAKEPTMSCQHCPAGSVSTGDANAACTPCAAGEYSNLARDTCVQCYIGSYSTVPGALQSSCTACSNGFVNAESTTCTICPADSTHHATSQANDNAVPWNGAANQCQLCPYQIVSTGGIVSCSICPAGQTEVDSVCVDCDAGTYRVAGSTVAPVDCPTGGYSAAGADLCTACADGEGAGTTTTCATCAFGDVFDSSSWDSALGLACSTCDESAGSYAATTPMKSCDVCANGEYIVGTGASAVCTSCPAGRFGASTGNVRNSVCTACGDQPADLAGTKASIGGNTPCTNCPAGSEGVDGQCVQCAAGLFNADIGSVCSKCPQGTVTVPSATGAISCVACGFGKWREDATDDTCTSCVAGHYNSAKAEAGLESDCLPCPPNTYSSVVGLGSACTACGTDLYAPSASLVVGDCKPCLKNHFLDAGLCTECPQGKFSLVGSVSACTPCAAGTYGPGPAMDCQDCLVARTYSAAGASVCAVCPLGSYTNKQSKSTTCLPCRAGTFHNTLTETEGMTYSSCSPCPSGSSSEIGTFIAMTGGVPVVGPLTSTSSGASDGTTIATTTATTYNTAMTQSTLTTVITTTTVTTDAGGEMTQITTSTDEVVRSIVSFTSQTGLTSDSCNACVPGRFQGLTGQVGCFKCDAGEYMPSTKYGSTSASECDQCAMGRYSAVATGLPYVAAVEPACKACLAGTYQSVAGSASCTDCPAGRFAAVEALPVCQQCASGTFSSIVKALTCSNCADGEYSNCDAALCTSAASCKKCAIGTFSNAAHINGISGSCTNCALGTVAGTVGTDTCTPCGVNLYSNSAQGVSCSNCEIGASTSSWTKDVANDVYTATELSLGGVGQVKCTACPSGYAREFAAVNSVCSKCSIGYYAAGSGSQCKICPAGRFGVLSPNADGINIAECQSCAAGEFTTAAGLTACTKCPAGTASLFNAQGLDLGTTVCLGCVAGKFAVGLGNAACTSCAAGTASNTASLTTACPACADGSYSVLNSALGTQSCTACTAGQFQASSATAKESGAACTSCAAGSFNGVATGVTACTPCAIGFFEPIGGASVCLDCTNSIGGNTGSGWFTAQTGQTACISCPGGTSSYGDAGGNCVPCLAGTYRVANVATASAVCPDCPIGRYSGEPVGAIGATECLACEKGKYQGSAGKTSCIGCVVGKYQDLTAAAGIGAEASLNSCTDCPAGSFSTIGSADGSPANSAVGSIVNTCTSCTAGTYSAGTGLATVCTACGDGFKASGAAAGQTLKSGACTACEAGKISAMVAGEQVCVPCPVGSYQTASGQATCTKCLEGRYGLTEGELTEAAACLKCAIGSASDKVGLAGSTDPDTAVVTGCPVCQKGSYQPKEGTLRCVDCPTGKFAVDDGSITCEVCPAGTYNDQTYITQCFGCLIGTFSSTEGNTAATDCTNCSGETQPAFAAVSGLSACHNCYAGTYGDADDAAIMNSVDGLSHVTVTSTNFMSYTTCTGCGKGLAGPESGAPGAAGPTDDTACSVSCDTGFFNPNTGASVCQECQSSVGTANQEAVCAPGCAAGSWGVVTPKLEDMVCTPCAEGQTTYSANTVVEDCEPCRAGSYDDNGAGGSCTMCAEDHHTGFGDGTSATGIISSNDSQCFWCPAGKYTVRADGSAPAQIGSALQCVDTPAGKYRTTTGSLTVKGDGTQVNAGRTGTDPCGANTYSDSGMSNQDGCDSCPANYVDAASKTGCAACSANTARDSAAASCSNCGAGSDSVSGSGCQSCGTGNTNPTAGQSCSPCPAGSYSKTTIACAVCSMAGGAPDEGWFSSSPGSVCESCTADNKWASADHTGCVACKDALGGGLTRSAGDRSGCTACKPGQIVNGAGDACEMCPADTYSRYETPGDSATLSVACEPCAAGIAVSKEADVGGATVGAGYCHCASGYTRKNTDWTDTVADPSGAKCAAANCVVGQYLGVTTAGYGSCMPCPAGRYCDNVSGCDAVANPANACDACSTHADSDIGASQCRCKAASSPFIAIGAGDPAAIAPFLVDEVDGSGNVINAGNVNDGSACIPVCTKGQFFLTQAEGAGTYDAFTCYDCPINSYCPSFMTTGCGGQTSVTSVGVGFACLPCDRADATPPASQSTLAATQCTCVPSEKDKATQYADFMAENFIDLDGSEDGSGCVAEMLLARR